MIGILRVFPLLLALTAAPLALAATHSPGHDAAPAKATGTADAASPKDGAAPGHPEEPPGLLSVDMGSAIWTIVLFVVLVAVLGKFVWPNILRGLQDRENRLRHDLEHAEDAARQADVTLKEYQARLAVAQEQARQIVEKSRADAERLAAQTKSEVQAEIQQLRQRAQNEIRLAKEQALAEIYAQTATLATSVAGRILQRELRPEDQQRLVDESLASLQKVNRG